MTLKKAIDTKDYIKVRHILCTMHNDGLLESLKAFKEIEGFIGIHHHLGSKCDYLLEVVKIILENNDLCTRLKEAL